LHPDTGAILENDPFAGRLHEDTALIEVIAPQIVAVAQKGLTAVVAAADHQRTDPGEGAIHAEGLIRRQRHLVRGRHFPLPLFERILGTQPVRLELELLLLERFHYSPGPDIRTGALLFYLQDVN